MRFPISSNPIQSGCNPWLLATLSFVSSLMACSAAPGDPSGSTSNDGQTYAPYQPPSTPVSAILPATVASRGSAAIKPEDMSEADLAEAMTPVRVQSGDPTLYRGTRPAVEVAHAIKTGQLLGQGSSAGALPSETTPGLKLDYLFQTSDPGAPSKQDSRFDESTLGYPFTTMVFLSDWCSGTYVGPHTLVTAAHCLYSATKSPLWTNLTFTPMAKGKNATVTSAPFGSYGPPGSGVCYDAWFPSGWANNPTDGTWDYATVDFRPCGNPTIARTGWMGITPNATVNWTLNVSGYPNWYLVGSNGLPNPANSSTPGASPGCGWGANPAGDFPFLCGESWVSGSYWSGIKLETNTISLSPGDSGGPWWESIGSASAQLIGITTAEVSYSCGFLNLSTCYSNEASGITTTVWNFIVSTTEIGH
jgi:trypsin